MENVIIVNFALTKLAKGINKKMIYLVNVDLTCLNKKRMKWCFTIQYNTIQYDTTKRKAT